jgi:hypothetical protein
MSRLRRCAVAFALALGACGGSSSESPWPVEPLEATHGPAERRAPGGNASDAVEGEPFRLLRPEREATGGGGPAVPEAQGGGLPEERRTDRPELDVP